MLSSKAYTEAFYIVNLMSEEMKSKIPETVIDNIKNRMDEEYEFYIDEEDIESVELLEDTEKILSVLYTDYLSTEEERKIILNKEQILASSKNNVETKSAKLLKIKEIFPEKEDVKEYETAKDLVKIKNEKWYTKIFDFIKKMFNK